MPKPSETSVQAVAEARDSDRPLLLIDVRTPEEHATARINGSTLIPLPELPNRIDDIADAASDLADEHDGAEVAIVTYCHHGMRSLQAAEILRAGGVADVQSMKGGIDAWSRQIDPSVPQY